MSSNSESVNVTEIPLSSRCARVTDDAHHALIAVSLFNGYYNRTRLDELIEWANGRFARFHVPVFDVPHAYTLAASGTPIDKAVRRAREEGQKMLRKLQGIFASKVSNNPHASILTWNELSTNRRYQELAIEVELAFHADSRFREACIAMANQFTKQGEAGGAYSQDVDAAIAVRYLLSELPLFIDTAGIIGVESSIFCYHRSYDFYKRFFDCDFSIRPTSRQAFLVVNFEE